MSLKVSHNIIHFASKKEIKEKETLVALSRRGCEPILLLLITAYLVSHVISRIYFKKETKTKTKP